MSKNFYYFFIIFAAAFFLRVVHLPQQGLIFSDEAAMVLQANRVWHTVFEMSGSRDVPQSFINAKIGWLMIVGGVQRLTGLFAAAGQIAAAGAGLLTIAAVYFVVGRIMKSTAVALWSALLLALSSNHVFYSRVGLPETTVGLLCFIAVAVFWLGQRDGRNSPIFISGLIFVMAALCLYRVIPVFLLVGIAILAEGRDRWRRILIYLSGGVFGLFICLMIVGLGRWQGVNFPSYIEAFRLSWQGHVVDGHTLSLGAYPYYLGRYETPLVCFLFLIGVFFSKKHPFVLFSVCLVIFQLLIWSIADEKGIRTVVLFLPFFSFVAAWGLVNVADILGGSHLRLCGRWLSPIICGVIVLNGSISSFPVMFTHSDMPQAVRDIRIKFPTEGILSTGGFVTAVYMRQGMAAQVPRAASIQDLKQFYREGYRSLIIEPQKFLRATVSGRWNEIQLNELVSSVEKFCLADRVYSNFNRDLFERLALEGTRPYLTQTFKFLRQTGDSAGQLAVYDIGACLKEIEKKLPP